jgi:ATP-dependent Clp protease, protease subunit
MPRRWFQMKAANGNAPAEVMIYGDIGASFFGEDAVSAKQFDAELKALGNVPEILLRVNSPGGDVFDGLAIFNTLDRHPAKITARVDAIAASAASLIVMAADKIEMPENTFMLIHEPRALVVGKADDMLAMAGELERMTASFVGTYAKRSGTAKDRIAALMKEDRLMSAAEAKALGLVDDVQSPVKMAANYDLKLLPSGARAEFEKKLKASGDPETPAPEPETPAEPTPPAESTTPAEPVEPDEPEPPPVGGKVVDIASARAAASRELRAQAAEVRDLCKLAGLPDMAGDFIAEGKSVADVRKALQTARAAADERIAVASQIPHGSKPAEGAAWDGVIAKMNARVAPPTRG